MGRNKHPTEEHTSFGYWSQLNKPPLFLLPPWACVSQGARCPGPLYSLSLKGRNRCSYLDERVRQALHPDTHGAVPDVALLRFLHRVPVHIDDFVEVSNQNLGHLNLHIDCAFHDETVVGVR